MTEISIEISQLSHELEDGEINELENELNQQVFDRRTIKTDSVADNELAGIAGIQAYSSTKLEQGFYQQVSILILLI